MYATLLLTVGPTVSPSATPSVIPSVAPGGGSGGGGTSTGGWITLAVAIIAACAAIFAAFLANKGVEATNNAARTAATRDYVLRQYNELYGPLFMRRALSKRLWNQLPGGAAPKPGRDHWRLIDNITDIQNEQDGSRREVVEKILKIDDELTDLIIGKAGLLEAFPPPGSFDDFLEHAATLRLLWARAENAAGATDKPFPYQFDVDVKNALGRLRATLDAST